MRFIAESSVQTAPSCAADLLPVFKIEFRLWTFLLALHLLLRDESSFLAAAELAMRHEALKEKLGGRNDFRRRIRCFCANGREHFEEALNLLEVAMRRGGWLIVVEFYSSAQVEPLFDLLCVGIGEVAVEYLAHRGANQISDHRVGAAHFSLVLQLKLAGYSRHCGVDITNTRKYELFGMYKRAPLGIGDD